VRFFDLAPRGLWRSGRRLTVGTEAESLRIELKQSRRLRGGIAEMKTEFHPGQLRRGARGEQETVAHRMQCAGTTQGATDLVTGNGFSDMMHHGERGPRGIAQTQQRLAQSRHSAGIVFVLIVSRVKRVQNDDLSGGGLRGGEKVIHPLRCAEQMSSGT